MAPLTFKLLLVLVLSLVCNCLVNAQNARITGGSATTIDTNKYVVSIRSSGVYICGGALVSSTHVVTAAHCVHNIIVATMKIRAGTAFSYQGGQTSTAVNVYIPSVFNMQSLYKDVAVIKLATALIGPNINTIDLCSHTLSVNIRNKLSGWGQAGPNELRQVQMQMIGIQACKQRYQNNVKRMNVTDSIICGHGPDNTGTCTGDGGIPLVSEGQLCGIASWGLGCGSSSPGVFTAVNRVKDFIREQMAK